MSGTVEGFEIPLHRSVTQPIMLAGAPRQIAIVNGTLAAAIGLGLQMWLPGLICFFLGHAIAVFAAKRDPHFLDVVLRHLRQKGHFEC